MKKFKFFFMAGLMAFTVTAFSGCGEELDKPTNITVSEDYKITWDKVEDARSYLVSIKDCDTGETTQTATRKPSMSLSNLEDGDYEIKVKAISGDKSFDNSGWSVVIPFTKYPETGCVYTLINNNTEYAITRVGTATGELVIEDYYRGKPVTEIADEAFKASSRLTSVVIGSKVRSIGENAFYNCTKLENVTFAANGALQTIGNSAFQNCSSLLSVSIPDGVSVISEETFAYCKQLETVEIASSVTTIEYGAFSDCFALRELTLPDSVKSIDSYAFSMNTSLTSVSFGTGVETIGDYAFYGCKALKTVTFSGGDEILTIEEGAFSTCLSLNNVTLPENLTSIGDSTFYMNESLDTISIPDSVYHVGRSAFNATKLYADAIKAGETFVYADDWLVGASEEKMKTVTALTADVLRSDVRGIAAYTFYYNDTLTKVILPDSLKYIDNYSFAHIETLSVMRTFTGTNGVVRIGRGAFYGDTVLSQVTLGEGLETIGDFAFYSCTLLNNNALAGNSLIPESVKEIGKSAFKYTAMWDVAVDSAVYAGNWLVGFNGEASLVSIKDGTVGIANYAFIEQTSLHTVEKLDQVKYLGMGAFRECASLSTLDLNNNLEEIKDYTFYGCTSLYKITLPRKLTKIGRSAFYECSMLNRIDFSRSKVTEIGPYAFFKCANLQTVDLGDSLESVADYAFYKCTALKELTIPDTVRTIGVRAFYKCEALETLNLSENTESIGEYAFYNCTALKSLSLPDSVKTIGRCAFYNCSAVEKLELGNKVETIGDYAFYGFEKVDALKLPASVGSIGKFAFKGWTSLETLVLSGDVSVVFEYAFYGCKALTIYTDIKAPTNGVEALPNDWSLRWNISRRPVVWGCTFSEDGSYVQALTVDKEMFTNSYTVLTEKVVEIGEDGTEVTTTKVVGKKFTINDPVREGYVFLGWATSKDSATAEYTTEELASLDEGTVVYAVWEVAPEEEPEEEPGTSEVPDASAEGDSSTENA